MDKESVYALKRSELISDIIIQLKDAIISCFMDIWVKVYKNENIPKIKWLEQFQLSLKSIRNLSDDDITDRLAKKKRIISNLYEAIMLTAKLFHDGAEPHIVKDKDLVIVFVRAILIQVARELWSKPYYLYNLTHKKSEVIATREILEKLISTITKSELRRMVDDVIAIEEERIQNCKEIMDLEAVDGDVSSVSGSSSAPSSYKSHVISLSEKSLEHLAISTDPPNPLDIETYIPSRPQSVCSDHVVVGRVHNNSPSIATPRSLHSLAGSKHASPAASVKSINISIARSVDSDDADKKSVASKFDYIPVRRSSMDSAEMNQKRLQSHLQEPQMKSVDVDNTYANLVDDIHASNVVVEKSNIVHKTPKPPLYTRHSALDEYSNYRGRADLLARLIRRKANKPNRSNKQETFFN